MNRQGYNGRRINAARFQDPLPRTRRLFTDLKSSNRLIGPNDLWIAASGTALDLPVLTRNVEEFQRVKGLKVVGY